MVAKIDERAFRVCKQVVPNHSMLCVYLEQKQSKTPLRVCACSGNSAMKENMFWFFIFDHRSASIQTVLSAKRRNSVVLF